MTELEQKERLNCLYERTVLWTVSFALMLIVGGLNSLWFVLPECMQQNQAKLAVIVVSGIGVLVTGVLVGNAIAGGAHARRLGGKRWDE